MRTFSLGSLAKFQIPDGNNFSCILMCTIILFFIAGCTSRRNKRNPVFQLVARAKNKIRLPYLLGSPTLSREAKILRFSEGLHTLKLFQTSFLSIYVFTTFSRSNGVVKHNIRSHERFSKSPI